LNEIGEEQEEAVRHQDFMQAQVLLEKMKELQEELQRLNAEPNVVHEQVDIVMAVFWVVALCSLVEVYHEASP
jgi:hypothetical protein